MFEELSSDPKTFWVLRAGVEFLHHLAPLLSDNLDWLPDTAQL
jgi:hypothetical protein